MRIGNVSLVFAVFSVAVSSATYSQTNTFPTSGNVGIGTTNPKAKLSINGYEPLSGESIWGADYNIIFHNGSIGDMGSYGQLWRWNVYREQASGSSKYLDYANRPNATEILMDGNIRFRTAELDTSKVKGDPVYMYDRLLIEPGGDVGIGTTNPVQELHILGTTKSTHLELNAAGGFLGYNAYYDSGWKYRASDEAAAIRFDAIGDLQFYTASSGAAGANMSLFERLRIKNNGNIGIGTSTPDHKLDVKGTIRAEEVIVETGWPDYVFEDGYDLPTLDEVETHIEENGHLPGIPSAEEIAQNGVSLGDSQRMLLEKVEELTLYMIQLKKENESLRIEKDTQISQLQEINEILVSRLEKLEIQ